MEGEENEIEEYGRNSREGKRKGKKGVGKIWKNVNRGKMVKMG